MATTSELRAQAVGKVDAQASRINLDRATAGTLLARECAQGRRCGPMAAACDALLAAYRAAEAVATDRDRLTLGGHSVVAFARYLQSARHAVNAVMVPR